MTTQADSARNSAEGMSLDRPAPASVRVPLPHGWNSFFSEPDRRRDQADGMWYATAPWSTHALREQFGARADAIPQTVTATTWGQLHQEVAFALTAYSELTGQ